MNLISCKRCGVVFDKDQFIFPDTYDHDTQELIPGNSIWDGNDHIAKIGCPICGADILETQ